MNRNKELKIVFTRTTINDVEEIEIKTIPQNVDYTYRPNFTSQSVLGRATPMYQYTGATGKSLSFSIELHEDIHVEAGESLDTLVQRIKTLSSPVVDRGGYAEEYPRVYFSLGELEAFVKVETDVTWKKPIRDGKYIMAEIGFKIDILEELREVEYRQFQEVVVDDVDGEVYYGDALRYAYSQEQDKRYKAIKEKYGIEVDNILIDSANLTGGKTYITTWDASVERIKNLYGAYQEIYGDELVIGKTTIDLKDKHENYSIKLPEVRDDYDRVKEDLEALRKQQHLMLEEYYKKGTITTAEREQIRKHIDNTINTLIAVASGVVGYGAAP